MNASHFKRVILKGIGALGAFLAVTGCTHIVSQMVLKDATMDRKTQARAQEEGYRASLLTASAAGAFEVNILKTPLMLITDVTALEKPEGLSEAAVTDEPFCLDPKEKYTARSQGPRWRIFMVPPVGLYVLELKIGDDRLGIAFPNMEDLEKALPLLPSMHWETLAKSLLPASDLDCQEPRYTEHDGAKLIEACSLPSSGISYEIERYVAFSQGFYFPGELKWHVNIESGDEVLPQDYCFTARGGAALQGTRQTNDVFRRALDDIEGKIHSGSIPLVRGNEGELRVKEFCQQHGVSYR